MSDDSGRPSHGGHSIRKSHLDFATGQSSSSPRLRTIDFNDGAGPASGVLGGIALGIRPPTVEEARLEQGNSRLREENKRLRTAYDPLQIAAKTYHHDAFRFHRENLCLQERLEAMSLEAKAIRLRHAEAKSLSETRLKRLLAARVFLTSEADSQSMSDLIREVESLNDDTDASNNAANPDAVVTIQDGADPLPTISTSTTSGSYPDATTFVAVQTNALPEESDQDENPRNHSYSEATSTTPIGEVADGLGLRPPTARKARLQKENYKLEEENKFLRWEYSNLLTAARKYHYDAFRFHHENKRLTQTLEATSLEVEGMAERYEKTKSLAESRGKTLLRAQIFLTKADRVSVSELIQKVDALNDEIYQAAASWGETIVQKRVHPFQRARPSSEASAITKELLGLPLCNFLRDSAKKIDKGVNPVLVQVTLQTFFSIFFIQRIRSWVPSHLALDATIRELYEKIWSSSGQAVSGRWRSLTRAQLKPDTTEWIKELTTELDAILALASWDIGSPEDRHRLEARLPAIFKVVLDVREAIGEKFTSADIEVCYVEPNTPFNDVYMEEAYAADSERHGKGPEIVIATVGMGVSKVLIRKEGRCLEYVLSPKVVLESSLEVVLGPSLCPTQSL